MSHLIFDKRDWKFLMREHLHLERLASFPGLADYDIETMEAVFDEGVKFAVERVASHSPARRGRRLA